MGIVVSETTTVKNFFDAVLPRAYRAGLHNVPAKYSSDMFLLLHSMTALLIADELSDYLARQSKQIEAVIRGNKEETWLATFLHDILKEASSKGIKVDHQDIRPDDVSIWLNTLGIELATTTPIRIAARIAVHERGGLPLLTGLADVGEDDLPQMIIRLSDQLASLTAINEHWHYAGHGLPGMIDTLNGRGRYRGINQLIQRLGAPQPLTLFSHYHTNTTYPYLTNQLLTSTVDSIVALGPQPLLLLADGVIYIATQSEYDLVKQAVSSNDDAEGATFSTQVLRSAQTQMYQSIKEQPVRPEDIRATQNGMKIYAQMRLVGTKLDGDHGLMRTLGVYLSQRVSTKSFGSLPLSKREDRVKKFLKDVFSLIDNLPKYYSAVLQVDPKNIPSLEYKGKRLTFGEFIRLNDTTPDSVFSNFRTQIGNIERLAASLLQFGEMLDARMADVNMEAFDNNIASLFAMTTEGALNSLIQNCIVVADVPLALRKVNKKTVERYCPICGQQGFKTSNGGKAVIQQRETFFPIAVKSHTNSGSGAESEGTRIMCQVCALELGLRGMSLNAEAFKNKQSVLYIHLLPFFSFPANWLDGLQKQFGFSRRGNLRAQFSEATLRGLFESLFAHDSNDWEWFNKISSPLNLISKAFFAADDNIRNRDEFFESPPTDYAGSVTLTLYTRRSEMKPDKSGLEDEIGRTEMWVRGATLSSILALALPVRVIVSESPLVTFNPNEIKTSLSLVNPPSSVIAILERLRSSTTVSRGRFVAHDGGIKRAELRQLLQVLIYGLRVNRTLGGSVLGKDGREISSRPSRRVVEIVQSLGHEMLIGAWLHQRDAQGREHIPGWFSDDYHLFTIACMEVDKMLNPDEGNRLRRLAQITQTFYSPPVYDSSHALTLPFKVATKTLQRFEATNVSVDEMKTIMRSDIESAVKRQADVEGSRSWIVLKRGKDRRTETDPPVSVQLSSGIHSFVECFVTDIVYGICGDVATFLMLRKRLQSGYMIQMKDLSLETWEREGWRMFKPTSQTQTPSVISSDDEFSVPA